MIREIILYQVSGIKRTVWNYPFITREGFFSSFKYVFKGVPPKFRDDNLSQHIHRDKNIARTGNTGNDR